MLIYVSCPYSAETLEKKNQNVVNAMVAGIEIMCKGHSPLVPTLMHFMDLFARKCYDLDFTWDDFMRVCLDLLKGCDAILYMGSSKGCDIELEYAKQNGMKVFYSVEEIPNAV